MAQCYRNSGSLKNGMVAQAHRTSGSFAPRLFNVSHFQTQRVLHMENMFYGCKCLKYLDLRGFDCSKAADLSYMFYGCQSLKNVLTAKRPSDRKHRAIMIELLAGCKKFAEEKKGMGI